MLDQKHIHAITGSEEDDRFPQPMLWRRTPWSYLPPDGEPLGDRRARDRKDHA